MNLTSLEVLSQFKALKLTSANRIFLHAVDRPDNTNYTNQYLERINLIDSLMGHGMTKKIAKEITNLNESLA